MSKNVYEEWKKSGELENILILVAKWRRDGAEINEIAEKLGLSRTTVFKYQNDYADFANALKKGKEIVDSEVENSLVKECIGYTYDETTTTTTAIVDKETGQITSLEKIETKKTTKYARPSVTAIAYYLNNRLPNKWKNKVVVDAEGDDGILPKLLEAMNNGKKSAGKSKDTEQSESDNA